MRTKLKRSLSLILFMVTAAALLPAACKSKSNGGKAVMSKNRILPVRVKAPQHLDVRKTIEFVGELKASESVEISSQITGMVEKITVHMGDRVEEGDLLVRIDDTDFKAHLQEAQASVSVYKASINKAAAEKENAESLLQRKEKLADQKLVTPQELDNAKTQAATSAASVDVAQSQLSQGQARIKLLKSQLGDSKIKAPFDGEIDARYLDLGAIVGPGTPILRLVKKVPILARFQVEERYIGEIRGKMDEGEVMVEVNVDAFPDEVFAGKIIRFSPGLQSDSRAAVVEAEIANEDGRLMPNMFCRVVVDFGLKENALVVPVAAVIENIQGGAENGGQPTAKIFVVEAGKARSLDVTLGWKQEDMVEILDGLAEGVQVVVEGQASLHDGAEVKIVGQGAAEGSAAADASGNKKTKSP